MAFKRLNLIPFWSTGYSIKRIATLIVVVCLGATGIVLIAGVFKLNAIHSTNNRELFPITKGNRLSLLNVKSKDNRNGNIIINITSNSIDRVEEELSLVANTSTLIQRVSFTRNYRDKLVADLEKREGLRPSSWRSDETQYTSDTQFLNYMKCPTSVRTKLLLDPQFDNRYLPEVPILMWNKHYSDEEYARLSQYPSIYGWQVATANVISSALSVFNTSSNTYLFDNDRSPGQEGCTTCAVIGNGGILNGSKMGREIDAHDYVFRVNVALTSRHEEDVGNKTSFYCAAFRSLSNSLMSGRKVGFKAPPYQKGIRYVFFPKTAWAYMFMDAVIRGKPAPRGEGRSPPNFQTKLTAEDLKLVHPDFERYLKFRWVNSSRQHRLIHRPSTGAIMLLLALHTCDKVDVYGFAGSFEKYSEYYYDTTFRKYRSFANHDSKAEKELWIKLHQLGVINLYTRE